MPPGKSEQEFVVDTQFFKNMENTDIIDADVKVAMELEHKNDTYYCHFDLRGMMHIPCDRCLDAMEHPVDTTFDIAVKFGPEYDDSNDDVLVIPETEAWLNVAYMLYDTLVLTVPMRHVHPQGQCNRAMAGVLNRHQATADIEGTGNIEEEDIPIPDED